jgi:hypothetical protein
MVPVTNPNLSGASTLDVSVGAGYHYMPSTAPVTLHGARQQMSLAPRNSSEVLPSSSGSQRGLVRNRRQVTVLWFCLLLTHQRGVPSLDHHKINITIRGVTSTARILHAHTSTAVSRTFMKQMQSGFFCLVENEAGFLMTYNTVLKIDYLLLFRALKYRSIYLIHASLYRTNMK